MDEQPVALAMTKRSPNSWVISFTWGVSPQPSQAPPSAKDMGFSENDGKTFQIHWLRILLPINIAIWGVQTLYRIPHFQTRWHCLCSFSFWYVCIRMRHLSTHTMAVEKKWGFSGWPPLFSISEAKRLNSRYGFWNWEPLTVVLSISSPRSGRVTAKFQLASSSCRLALKSAKVRCDPCTMVKRWFVWDGHPS